DSDLDGIGDLCDTDNPYPQVDLSPIIFVEQPQNGTIIGKIEATDPEGETVSFALIDQNLLGILSIDSTTGALKAENGSALTLEAYGGRVIGVRISDGVNAFNVYITLEIRTAPEPPQISVVTFEVGEDAPVGTLVGLLQIIDPMGGDFSVEFDGKGYFELVGNQIMTISELDYEEIPTAEGPDGLAGAYEVTVLVNAEGLSAFEYLYLPISDIPNTTYTGRFFISVFDIINESLTAKVDHSRYFNPFNKTGVGKWKIKKRITGGADAHLFVIRETNPEQRINEDESEGFLDFINPPDFENPQDHNLDNVYEVEIEYYNTEDGSIEVPIPVTQFQIQVPETVSRAIELQSIATEPTQDSDGDGIVDIYDNAPLVANADQTDLDGDGVGDVSDDFDHDGVFNPYDNCAETPLGELVDINGCEIFYLPPNNFNLSKTEKCIDSNSISVGVIVTDEVYDVHVTGAGVDLRDSFTGSSWTLDNLSAGTYNVCFTVAGISSSEFERCFEVTITEPDPLSVYATMSSDLNMVQLNLAGGQVYNVTHNGKTTQTKDANYSVTLKKGYNSIKVDTGIECQGVFEHEYFVSNEVRIAPNPFVDQLMIYVAGDDRTVNVEVFTSQGALIHSEKHDLDLFNRSISLTTSGYQQGSYIIKVTGETTNRTITAIKQ
ncbi:MAG: thrombospondin type 3 repeat-containing protein, partial [Flavobacteriaceae bacterium]